MNLSKSSADSIESNERIGCAFFRVSLKFVLKELFSIFYQLTLFFLLRFARNWKLYQSYVSFHLRKQHFLPKLVHLWNTIDCQKFEYGRISNGMLFRGFLYRKCIEISTNFCVLQQIVWNSHNLYLLLLFLIVSWRRSKYFV